VDRDEAFDYENGVSKLYQKQDYINIILKEAEYMQKHRKAYLEKVMAQKGH